MKQIRPINQYIYHLWQDILLVIAFFVIGAIVAFLNFQSTILSEISNLWFDADTLRSFQSMVWHDGNHARTSVHPLFVITTLPPVYILRKLLDAQPFDAVKLLISIAAGLWLGSLFTLFRVAECRRLDAAIFSLLGVTSAAYLFWFTVPETYSFGSLSILLALCFVALAQQVSFASFWYVGVSALTLSFTITNWMVGLAATVANHRWKRSLLITIGAFLTVGILTVLQKALFKTAVILGFIDHTEEAKFIAEAGSGGALRVVPAFFFHTLVMPAINIIRDGDEQLMSVQFALPGSAHFLGVIAVLTWTALLGIGFWALFTLRTHHRLRFVVGVSLIGQLLLHLIYGDETFLYSLHFLPLLLILVALGTLTRLRPLVLGLALTCAMSAGINNWLQLQHAEAIVSLHQGAPPTSERAHARLAMFERPDNLWSRGEGHVVLAAPGSLETDKAYHEPGGSFSPSVGSFGVSIWMVDPMGKPTLTSDTIPMNQIRQRLVWEKGQNLPEIFTETNAYQARWSLPEQGRSQLVLTQPSGTTTKPVIAIRSIGPAGGPIHTLRWENQTLWINNRWSVKVTPSPVNLYVGNEQTPDWQTQTPMTTEWQDETSWGYARLVLGGGQSWTVTILDTQAKPKPVLGDTATQSTLAIDLPDPQFAASLNAQVAHIAMSIVGKELRPGEPTNYPLPWLRDGAYKLIALASAGQLDLAKQLSEEFAKKDFFGGFGPEADAPGLAIWGLETVAKQVNDPAYDRWLWTHVRRKAELILAMLATDQPMHRPVTAPIVPSMQDSPELTLVAEPAKDGLIVGRMDGHRPLLFVNAVSYRGLMDAAALADRVDQPVDAKRWRTQAAALKQAWQRAFQPPEADNDRTYISGLWQTWIARDMQAEFLRGLQARWTRLRDDGGGFKTTPLWTYFDLAEAHQWLFLGQPEQTWKTIQWFWDHQASPGLYTWWEGAGEENTSRRWEAVRGWLYPPHVTPHYWTAAEMLLLQLDMLAYLDDVDHAPTLIVGAGIPTTWVAKPMSVKGIHIGDREVSWNWDGKQVQVQVRGPAIPVKLGPGFPKQTPLLVEYGS